jgi:hypothetical protein
MEIGQDMWIQYEFESPQTVKAFTIVGASSGGALAEFRGNPDNRTLKVSDDGVTFRDVVVIRGKHCPSEYDGYPSYHGEIFQICF